METSGIINIDKELCEGCGRCKEVCPVDAIYGEEGEAYTIDQDKCVMCGQCVQICSAYDTEFNKDMKKGSKRFKERGMIDEITEPIFAAYNKGTIRELREALKDPNLFTVVQCAPAIRVSLGEDFGLDYGTLVVDKIPTALRKLGFNRVYDTNFGADVTIMEEGTELIERLKEHKNLPMFTSCCPAWVKFIEQDYPDLLNHLSSCKSPQQMAGALFKSYGAKINDIDPKKIFSVAIMPCTCKQYEADREEMQNNGYKDVDLVVTTRQLAVLLKAEGIDLKDLEPQGFDVPLGGYCGAGAIFGVTGGVMEAAIRTGYELASKKPLDNFELKFLRGGEGIREAKVDLGGQTLNVAMVAGLKNVRSVLDSVRQGTCNYDFVEVMACPNGCISGGGQPKLVLQWKREEAYSKRRASIYDHDKSMEFRKSHENPNVKRVYEEFLGKPLGEKSHHLLHTKYKDRSKNFNKGEK